MNDLRYVIRRTDQSGGYVAMAGQEHSYTNTIRNMRKFDSVQEANENRCEGNEIVVPLSELIN